MNRFLAVFVLILGAVMLAQTALAGEAIVFKNRGKLVRTVTSEELEKIAEPKLLKVWEPNESAEVSYRGFPFQVLLDLVYGKTWRMTEELLFTCSDGYQPSLPVARILTQKGYLAFERIGGDFEIVNKLHGNERVKVGPYYLIWDNLNISSLHNVSDAGNWPYQLTTVDLISFNDHFPSVAPPAKASAKAKAGFVSFRNHCISCHSINGEGGSVAPELNYPVSVMEYYNEAWLKKWVLDPTSVRYRTLMPALAIDVKDRPKIVDEIIAYLKAMKDHKSVPKAGTAK